MAIGYGLENDIRDAYVYLMQTCEADDCVYLFGFSRGAYTVRAVASLISLYGMLRPGNEAQVPYAIRMMMTIRGVREDSEALDEYFSLAREFKATMSCGSPRLRFVGIWDTVSSVGWIENPLHLPYATSNGDIEVGRHAVSIDEHRAFFRTNLWVPRDTKTRKGGPVDLLQVWFPGVHCDVGGGYPEEESGISKYPLEWMIEEAKAAGLLVDETAEARVLGKGRSKKYVAASPKACRHESLTGWWNLAEFVPKRVWDKDRGVWERRMNLYRRRTMPDGAFVHDCVRELGEKYCKRLPDKVEWVSTRTSG